MRNEFMKIEKGSDYLKTTMFYDDSICKSYDFKNGKKGKIIVDEWFIRFTAEKDITGIREENKEVIKRFQINLLKFLDFLKEMDKQGNLEVDEEEHEDGYNLCIYIKNMNEIAMVIYGDLAKLYKREELQKFLKNINPIIVPQKVTFDFVDSDKIKSNDRNECRSNSNKLTQEEKEYIYEQIGEAVNDCDIDGMVALLEMIYEDEEEEDEE